MKKIAMGLGLVLLAAPLAGARESGHMGVEKRDFGHTADGKAVTQYVLTNSHGLEARVMSYGATWTHMRVPDRNGKFGDVLLGFDSLKGYLAGHPYFGSVVGRVGNRIAKGKFTLDGHDYQLGINNGPNSLHGGLHGTDKAVWDSEAVTSKDGPSVHFHYIDPDGNNGYPGTVQMDITYTLTDRDEMRLSYHATTDKATPINLTNHAYFNLGTPGAGNVLGHIVQINADSYTPVDDTQIPTGQILPVAGTPFDFREPTPIGKNIDKTGGDPLGFDHNWVLRSNTKHAAHVLEPKSGRQLDVYTDQPGLQFYTGNFLDGTLTGKDGVVYRKYQSFCMETQHFPDSINHPNFPNTVLRPGEVYHTTTSYRFSVSP